MSLLRTVPSAILVFTAILLSQAGSTAARAMGLDDDNLPISVRNRNYGGSWWTKKSVGTPSDLTPIVPDAGLDASDLQDSSPDAYTKLYGCYTSICVPDFISCTVRSRTTSSFEVCKLAHRTCAIHCWHFSTSSDSSMK